jgi:hypothetical protein
LGFSRSSSLKSPIELGGDYGSSIFLGLVFKVPNGFGGPLSRAGRYFYLAVSNPLKGDILSEERGLILKITLSLRE